jgi:guanylate kinase
MVAGLKRVVTTTTRPMREGECEGREYFFRTPEAFEDAWKRGDLFERAAYRGNWYGLQRSQVETVLRTQEGIIIMEVNGAQHVLQHYPCAHILHMLPLSPELIQERMKIQGRPPEVIAHRLDGIAREYEAIRACIEQQECTFGIDNSLTIEEATRETKAYILGSRTL